VPNYGTVTKLDIELVAHVYTQHLRVCSIKHVSVYYPDQQMHSIYMSTVFCIT
jgi:hypothetical protein